MRPEPQITLQIAEGGYIVTTLQYDEDLEAFEKRALVFTSLDNALSAIKRCAMALEGPDDSPVSGDIFGGMRVE